MRYKNLRQIIRLFLIEQLEDDDLLVEPEEIEGDSKEEFSAGGVAGAPAVSRKRNFKKK
jgi:hypothetical protein